MFYLFRIIYISMYLFKLICTFTNWNTLQKFGLLKPPYLLYDVHKFVSNSKEHSNVCVSGRENWVYTFNQQLAPGVCRGGNYFSFRQTSWRDLWPELNLVSPLLGLIKYTQLVLERAGLDSQSNASFTLSKDHIVLCAQDSGELSDYINDMFLASLSTHFPSSVTSVITVMPAWERRVSCFATHSQWMPSNGIPQDYCNNSTFSGSLWRPNKMPLQNLVFFWRFLCLTCLFSTMTVQMKLL